MNRTASEYAHSVHGVAGRMLPAHVWPVDARIPEAVQGGLSSQTWVSEMRPCPSYGRRARIQVTMRFDDNCKNGHASFGMTADITNPGGGDRNWLAGGCCHDEIAAAFPELAHLIRYHLMSTDSPMHYIANTLYHAGDRDHYGRRAGEVSSTVEGVRFGAVPIIHRLKPAFAAFLREIADYDPAGLEQALTVLAVAHDDKAGGYKFSPKYQFAGQKPLKWHECPFDDEAEALRFALAFALHSPEFVTIPTAWSEGKPRDLDAARSAGVWPDATDADLMADRETLKAALEARLPALVAAFRAAMDGVGFAWEAAELS